MADDDNSPDWLLEIFTPPVETPVGGQQLEPEEPEEPEEPAVVAEAPTDGFIEALLRDYASGLYPIAEIAERTGMLEEHVRTFVRDPYYEPLLRVYRAEWLADGNQPERVQRQARIVIEEGIGVLGRQLMDPDPKVPMASRLAVFDSVAKLTGLVMGTNPGSGGGGGPQMAINIHISGRDAVQVGAAMEQKALAGG